MCRTNRAEKRGGLALLVDSFPRVATLHRGQNSVVYRSTTPDGVTVVAKRYHIHAMTGRDLDAMRKEVRLLQAAQAVPGVIRLLDARETALSACLVMEDCKGGDLFSHMRSDPALTQDWVVTAVIRPLLCTLSALHSRGIVHRDIKPENIVLDGAGGIRLADFGLSINQQEEIPFLRAGTLDYMAPEIVRSKSRCDHTLWEGPCTTMADLIKHGIKPYNEKVDTWAVGVLAYELLTGQAPFFSPSQRRTLDNIASGREPYIPACLAGTPAEDFVLWALACDPGQRPSAQQLLAHPWVAGVGVPAAAGPGPGTPPQKADPTPRQPSEEPAAPVRSGITLRLPRQSLLDIPGDNTSGVQATAQSGGGRRPSTCDPCQDDIAGALQALLCRDASDVVELAAAAAASRRLSRDAGLNLAVTGDFNQGLHAPTIVHAASI